MYLLELAESIFGEYAPFHIQMKMFLQAMFQKREPFYKDEHHW